MRTLSDTPDAPVEEYLRSLLALDRYCGALGFDARALGDAAAVKALQIQARRSEVVTPCFELKYLVPAVQTADDDDDAEEILASLRDDALVEVLEERDALAAQLAARDERDLVALVDATMHEHDLPVEKRAHLLNWARLDREGFTSVYPVRGVEAALRGREFLLRDLSGTRQPAPPPIVQPDVVLSEREAAKLLANERGISLGDAQLVVARMRAAQGGAR